MMGSIMRRLWIVLIIVVAASALLGVLVVAVTMFLRPGSSPFSPGSDATPPATSAVLAPLPPTNPAASGGPSVAELASPDWIAKVAAATSIPTTALQAYAGVALSIAKADPSCGLSWNTLAAVGWVESHNGQLHGRTLSATGEETPPLYGVALDGNGYALIPDSDGGKIDGDTTGDRAVGPMQFVPNSWRNWHTDANGDGVEDVQNIFDSSMAAGHYLCRAGKNLDTMSGWRTSILAYNSSNAYLQEVIDAANNYADEAATA
jgi:membrane-bound lytic murein transglycosylase B